MRAPLIEAQIVETYLLAMVGFQSLIATKARASPKWLADATWSISALAARIRRKRACWRAAPSYIGGCVGTSNTETGIPLWHSCFWNRARTPGFRPLQPSARHTSGCRSLLGDATVYLIDTYDTMEGARLAAQLGPPLWGVRLDSGNLVELSRAVRKILDDAGHART